MHVTIDNLIQIIAFCSGFGALVVLAYLAKKTGKKKAVLALKVVVYHTVNYFIGITFSLSLSTSLSSALTDLLTIIQLLSVLLFMYSVMLFIESLGEHPSKALHSTGMVLFGLLLAAEVALYLSSFTSLVFSHTVTIVALLCAVFLWIYLLLVNPANESAKTVRITGLIGYAVIIPANAIEKFAGRPLEIHPAGAASFLFLTVGVLVFSTNYLLSGAAAPRSSAESDGASPAGRLELQMKFGLTDREMEVLDLLRSASSYKSISSQLGISMPTVKTHVSKVYRKTGTRGRSELKYRFRNVPND